MTKLKFSVMVTIGITLTLGYLAAQTENPASLTLPIIVIVGGSLYASRSLFDQVRKVLKKQPVWTRYSSLVQGSRRSGFEYTKRRQGRRVGR